MTGRPRASSVRPLLRGMPTALAAMLVGLVLLGALGAAAGLVIGLRTYPPTAWFAALEVGVPAAGAGALLGLVVGVVAQRVLRGRTPPVDDDFAGTPPGW